LPIKWHDFHIVPLLGAVKLCQLTVPMVRHFEDKLRVKRSPAMVRKVLGSLSAILGDAQERGLVSQDVARVGSAARNESISSCSPTLAAW
jgi:integrase